MNNKSWRYEGDQNEDDNDNNGGDPYNDKCEVIKL